MAIDLRSDTVTRPSPAMREAMAQAEVGDDVYGEDPTVKALERETAALLGKAAALFVSSGTMGNQLAILSQTNRGDELYTGEGAHCAWYESGAAAAWAGVQPVEIGGGGVFDGDALRAAVKPRAFWCPNPRLVVIENTHNRGGGRVFPEAQVRSVEEAARALDLRLHLDGARLWNAAEASGTSERELAAGFDTVTVCFSKGLGAPVGSVLCGDEETIKKAHRYRKMMGGGMRQAGVLAAACRFALAHNRARLADDHAHARLLADHVRDAGVGEVPAPETNIVMIDLPGPTEPVVAALAARGVLVSAFGPRRLRVVTHLDVDRAAVLEAAAAIVTCCSK